MLYVIVHQGEYVTNGHVFAYVRAPDGYWYKADDELVTPVHLDSVLNHKDAYILCYVKMPQDSIYLSDDEPISSPIHSSSILISSTPTVFSYKCFDKACDIYEDKTSLSDEESIPSNNCMDIASIDDNSFSDTNSSNLNDIFSDNSLIQQRSTQRESMTLSTSIDTSSIQLDEDDQDSQVENDFVAKLPPSHQFNLRSVDLAKLQVIRTEKNNNKKKRLLEKMGLIDESANKTTKKKKKFITKQINTFKAMVGNVISNEGPSMHIESTIEKKSNVDVTYFYILLPYLKQLNKFCGLCVRNCTFGATNDAHHTYRSLAMWCIALLIHTLTWNEFLHNWTLITIDEEQQANSIDSPFKSTITKLFYDILRLYSISIKQVHDRSSRGILRWFKYLIVSFMPTTPIWSNLLLGNLSRHSRQIIHSLESITTTNEEQLTTAISERRMCIVKRIQLVPDMMIMIDEYWNTLLGYSTSNDHTIFIDEQRLKPIEERWREKVSRRGAGFYTKRPSEPIVNDLISCLLTPQVNINENLKLPVLSPIWLDVAIGILLSVGNDNPDRHVYMSSLKNSSPLLSKILKFLKQWLNLPNKTIRSTNIDISSLNIQLNDPFEQSSFILENILIPLLPCQMIIYKIHECNRCKLTTKIRSSITSIPINSSTTGLYLEQNLFAYFAPTQSDLVCSNCNTATMRRIEVQQWPQVLLLNFNNLKQVTRPRRPSSMLSLGQFSSWNAIGFPSSSIYHLTCFNSIIKSGDYETIVRTTKVKKSWRTSHHHTKTIGEGEQFQRLYAHSRTLVFERIFVANKYNLVHAIIQGTGLKCSSLINDAPQSISIQDALEIIQSHPLLSDLNNTLIANVKTKYICDFCHQLINSFEEQSSTIFLFKSISSNDLVAYPALFNINYENVSKKYCTNCNHSIENAVMNVHQQVFLKCPYYLISSTTATPSTDTTTTPSTDTTTTPSTDTTTTPSTDTTTTPSTDTTPVPSRNTTTALTNTTTPSTIHNNITINSSQMRIISQINLNGVQRLIIADDEVNMYFPIGSFRSFSLPIEESYEIIFIRTTRDRLKLVLLTPTVISIWLTKPSTLVGLVRRSENSIAVHGENVFAEWRNDTQKLALSTTKGYIIYYKVVIDKPKASFFGSTNDEDPCEYLIRLNTEAQFVFPMVRIKLTHDSALHVDSNIQGLTNLGPDLLVADDKGYLYRISWDGIIHQHLTLCLSTLSYTTSLNADRVFKIHKLDRYAKYIEFSSLLNGIGIVFNDGTSGLIICETSKFEPQQCQCIVIQPTNDEKIWKTHCCVALNAIYQLLAFGSTNGQGLVYYIDELTASLQLAFKIQLSVENFPDLVENLGALYSMKWSPDYRVLCTLWENGAFAIWTVFGILLHCSHSSEQSLDPMQSYGLCHVIEWGPDGYTLWVASHKSSVSLSTFTDDDVEVPIQDSSQIILLNFLKSSVINNPHSGSIEHLLLQSEDKVYLYLSGNQQSTNGNNNGLSISVGCDVGWQVIQLPQLYIHNNWPIKFACIDNTGQYLAVAGQHGFVHLSLFTRKWKLFGNAGQERDIRVVGGLLWWKEFILCGCTSTSENRDEIRLYSRLTNLDNQFSNVTRLQSPIICLNIYDDTLIVFAYDLHIMLYALERKEGKPVPNAFMVKLHEISVEAYVPHAVFVPFIGLTSLRTDSGLPQANTSSSNDNTPQSILINVCGRLLLLQQERGGSSLVLQKPSKKNSLQSVTFLPPVMIAACVECIWTISQQNSTNPYLSNALWLCCGLHGMKVWLPLYRKVDEPIFQSHRIMLTFGLTIYPLAVVVEEAVILGAMAEFENFNSKIFCSITKTTQVFLNHVFQELIRKNLDFDALQIAQTCKSIPHFSHVLELLLHKVLEEEATSTQPIPDPLLPRVTDFIKLFPQFLRIVSHCARKTEVALWPCLFSRSIIGDPKKLFQQCLTNNNLETAASYLIIIQNLEKSEISQKFAQVLLEHALDHDKWELATDILRFIRSIDPQDLNNDEYFRTINTRFPPSTTSNRVSNSLTQKSPLSPNRETLKFSYVTNMRQRTPSVASTMTNTSTITTIPEAPPLPTSLNTTKPKTSWPSGSTVVNNNSSNVTTPNSPLESLNNSTTETRRRKASSSDNKSPKKDSDTQQQQQQHFQSFDSFDGSLPQSPITSLSIHFIQRTLNQHALKAISKGRLRHLGYMAANIADFDLLNWLKNHKHESELIVSNYPETLKALHMEFNWPFPVLLSSTVYFNPIYLDNDSVASSTDNNGHHSDSGLGTNDRNGDQDEKYSTQVSRATSKEEMNVNLTPKKHKDFLETLSLTSETSSMPIDNEFDDLLNNHDIESLSQELANRGPQLCEKQIRYLYDIFLMADCYDWSFLLSLILKSQAMITQVMNATRIQDLSTQIFALQRGLVELETWAESECPEYKPLLLFVRNQAQTLINQRRTNLPSSFQSVSTKKLVHSNQDNEFLSLKQTHTNNNRSETTRKKLSSRNRTNSATDSNQQTFTFDSLSNNTQQTNNKNNRDTSPSLHTRRFSDDIVFPSSPSSDIVEQSLFSPGSVRARTISSIQEDKNLPSVIKKQKSLSTSSTDHQPPPSPPKRLDIRLSSGKTVDTSDFIHTDHEHSSSTNHLINPHIEVSHNQQQQNQLSNETARDKLLQSVYVNNTNTNMPSLSESLTNGTNYHTPASESSSNCVLS
ncbi:unnamed protein product [Rotaria sordida]|uniref:Protein RIC1 homolog n=1 Tax=Rotaria sordida TaxID=392033 RepID=A0A813STB1_9BILA|nr:unnamed protein product [Rotaria sordida]